MGLEFFTKIDIFNIKLSQRKLLYFLTFFLPSLLSLFLSFLLKAPVKGRDHIFKAMSMISRKTKYQGATCYNWPLLKI